MSLVVHSVHRVEKKVSLSVINFKINKTMTFSFNPGKKEANKERAANKISGEKKEQGFDCIVSTASDEPVRKMVYWEPGACIALGIVTLKSCKQCSICMDYYTSEMGFTCPKGHFQCWECFEQNVEQAFKPGAVGKAINRENGNLFCPIPRCNEEIPLLSLAKEKVPDNIFKMYEKQRFDFEANKAVEKALIEQKARLIKQRKKLIAILDKEARDAEIMRLDIVENTLTLRCPRCKTAFIDYSGCAALTCGICKAGFCALCLKDCGNNAHSHVANCPEKKMVDPYFLPESDFKEIHRKRRESLIKNKIREEMISFTHKKNKLKHKKLNKIKSFT